MGKRTADGEEPTWRDKNRIGALMSRVLRHANGELEMTTTQLKAADIYLRKTVPDLARTEHTGKDGAAMEHVITHTDRDIIAQYLGTK